MVNRATARARYANGGRTLETNASAGASNDEATVNRDYLTDSRVKTVTARFRQSRVSRPLTPVATPTRGLRRGE